MNQNFTKDTILKLLSGMSSEKEIRKYLDRFSSDEFRFAVIKVGGAVIEKDLENLISSLVFLNEVGLRPVIVHGGGPRLSRVLEEKKIKFSFKNGQRVTSKEVLIEAIDVFKTENNKITSALQNKNVSAVSMVDNIFKCNIEDKELGFVGTVIETNAKAIKQIISDGGVPVIAPMGYTDSNQIVNINGDKATQALAKVISPDKVIFLSEIGGIFDGSNKLISNINIKDDFERLMSEEWLHSGMKLKLKEIKLLLDFLPSNSSVSITKPLHLNRELFTDAGFGTLVKAGHQIDKIKDISQEKMDQITSIFESSFQGNLNKEYFKNVDREFYVSSCKRASIAISFYKNAVYMDKFAVKGTARGEGLGNAMWNRMLADHSKIFWRSRSGNSINNFYKNVCDGFQKNNDWNIFWIGISDLDELTECITIALKQPETITYDK